jgi:hypothetical protein
VTTAREHLPNRRECSIEDMNHDGLDYSMSVGFDSRQKLSEVFISTVKGGSSMCAMLEDFAVVVSVALQYGVTARELGASMGRVPEVEDALTPRATLPASPLGQVLDRLAEIERGEAA